ncbi:50S ribosomal protein L9 [Candidatus Peregrinibacteria bacterium]|nr:50S ribosomal protein L9 [Candidatus Peregrinibacteria bacterium]
MEVILLQNVKGLGQKGEVIKVKDGYFLNMLAPKKLAQKATPEMVKRSKEKQKKQIIEQENLEKQAKQVKSKLDGLEIEVKGKTQGEKLFASITDQQILDAILDKVQIRLNKNNLPDKLHIKEVGEHDLVLNLPGDLKANLKINVKATVV